MTTHDRDKVIDAAKEAGFLYYGEFPQDYKCKIEELYAIAHEAGRQAEREDCAKVCDFQKIKNTDLFPYDPSLSISASECAEAIRARGDTK